MFNIHPTELLLILIVALLVIGPERLPGAVRTVSLWVGRLRRNFYRVKAELEQEIDADGIRRQLHNEAVLANIKAAQSEVDNTVTDATTALSDTTKSLSNIVNSRDLDPGAAKNTWQNNSQVPASNTKPGGTDHNNHTPANRTNQTGTDHNSQAPAGNTNQGGNTKPGGTEHNNHTPANRTNQTGTDHSNQAPAGSTNQGGNTKPGGTEHSSHASASSNEQGDTKPAVAPATVRGSN